MVNIAIQGHPTREKEVIQILEDLGGENRYDESCSNEKFVYFINSIGFIFSVTQSMCSNERKIYTLDEFKKEFPFKVGDKVITSCGNVGIISSLRPENGKNPYCVKIEKGYIYRHQSELKPYKGMEKRNITLTLDKAKEWYQKGEELREIALQAFKESELNPRPRSWEEYTDKMALIRVSTDKLPLSSLPKKYIALYKLEQLRDCWIQDWKPNWLEGNVQKYVIQKWRDKISIETPYVTHSFLAFPTREMAEEFLKCFRDLIEKAGDLI